jgi:hypothetical protein
MDDLNAGRPRSCPSRPPANSRLPQTLTNGFEGHILNDTYELHSLLRADLARQERSYGAFDRSLSTTVRPWFLAKEFCLTNIPPKLYKSRRRRIRNFVRTHYVLDCIDYCGKKFIICDDGPYSDPFQIYDDAFYPLSSFREEEKDLDLEPVGEVADDPKLLGGTPGDDNPPRTSTRRRRRARRGRRRTKLSDTPRQLLVDETSDSGQGALSASSQSDGGESDSDEDEKL